MKNTRILLVEADPVFADLLNSFLSKMGVTKLAIVPDFKQGWASFLESPPHICLLDVGIGEGNTDGVSFAKRIIRADGNVKFIFMATDFTEENYQRVKTVHPVSFMSKDIAFLKLKQTIELAFPDGRGAQAVFSTTEPEMDIDPRMKGNQFFFRIGDVYKAIPMGEVSFFTPKRK